MRRKPHLHLPDGFDHVIVCGKGTTHGAQAFEKPAQATGCGNELRLLPHPRIRPSRLHPHTPGTIAQIEIRHRQPDLELRAG